MLINLQKSFCFARREDTYQVDYVFKDEPAQVDGLRRGNIFLLITYAKNNESKLTEKIANASTMLSQSNESINQLIEDKVLSFY